MAHLLLAIDTSPQCHKDIPEWLNRKFSYTYTNEKTGETKSSRPMVREVRLYEVVIKRNVIPQLLDDLSLWQKIKLGSGVSFSKFYSLIKKFIPFEIPDVKDPMDYMTIEQIHNKRKDLWNMQRMGGPLYIQPIGILPDMINEDGEDML
jgi:hypothetical protein